MMVPLANLLTQRAGTSTVRSAKAWQHQHPAGTIEENTVRIFWRIILIATLLLISGGGPTLTLAADIGVECFIDAEGASLYVEVSDFRTLGEWVIWGPNFIYSSERLSTAKRKRGRFTFTDNKDIFFEAQGTGERRIKGARLSGFISADAQDFKITFQDPSRDYILTLDSSTS